MENSFLEENLLPRLAFNPGLTLTGFRTTGPEIFLVVPPEERPEIRLLFAGYLAL